MESNSDEELPLNEESPADEIRRGEREHGVRRWARHLDPRHSFVFGWLAGAGPSIAIFYWFLTNGSLNPFRAEFTSDFYDVQAHSIWHGTLAMPAEVLSIEGFRVHGHEVMYFGPTLAILRLPIALLWPSTRGHLSGLSMLVAYGLILALSAALFIRIRSLVVPNASRPIRREQIVVAMFVMAVGLGSVVLFLSSYVSVYQ